MKGKGEALRVKSKNGSCALRAIPNACGEIKEEHGRHGMVRKGTEKRFYEARVLPGTFRRQMDCIYPNLRYP